MTLAINAEIHEPTSACAPGLHCYSHDIDEPFVPGGDYTACGECFHVYRTKGELRREYKRQHPDPQTWRELLELIWHTLTVRADDIPFCPLCMHDF